jgi:SAM-dependent methyltransferase
MTLAERCLIERLGRAVQEARRDSGRTVRVLNLGAGKSTVVEDELIARGHDDFVADRLDIAPCAVEHAKAGRAYQCSMERMPEVPSAAYRIVFSVYVLEHVPDLVSAAREITRVIEPGGMFVATVPNPAAPEHVVSRRTAHAFHKWAKRLLAGAKEAWETHHAYRRISALVALFEGNGLGLAETSYSSFTQAYLRRFRVLRILAKGYDSVVNALKLKCLQGNVCLVFRKQS